MRYLNTVYEQLENVVHLQVINLYSSVFETCFYRPAGGNHILICLPHAKENPDAMQAILDEKFDFVKSELKLDKIEKAVH
jgi:hypothetical protein